MENYFHLHLPEDDIRNISSIGLAHLGDAVYELMVRSWLCAHGKATGKGLHRAAVELVRAEAQAAAMDIIMPLLTEKEIAVYKRGRNAHTARNSDEYHRATGLETLFGYLYLNGEIERVQCLFAVIMGDTTDK